MKKTLLLAFICLSMLLSLNAQETQNSLDSKKFSSGKMVYAEFGGPGILFSFNFDSRFSSSSNLGLGYRVGFGFGIAYDDGDYYYSDGDGYHYRYYHDDYTSYATIPLGLNYIFGKPNSPHTFEVGIGATILTKKMHLFTSNNRFQEGEGGNFVGHASFMYRKQPLNGGFTWRIGFTPILGTSGDIMLSAAVGIGYAF